ncbi:hypothetical protein V6N13_094794 [Hibiscus sabdariffa]|uniref:Uncharacterized protein n=1 Tax=Hibiscus sabdariffa TaxID=183260 RepID=A0ABR2PUD0_9ROSI
MENPSDFGFSDVAATTAVDDPAASNHGGQPPDNYMWVDTPASLECLGSPISVELQPSNKKGRSLGVMEHHGGTGGVPLTEFDIVIGKVAVGEDSRQSVPSFCDKLLNSSDNNMGSKSIAELDVEVKNEDVRLGALVNAQESVDIIQEVDHLQHDRRVEHSLTIKDGTPVVNVHPLDVSDRVSKEANSDVPGGKMVVQISEGRASLKKQLVENIRTINEEDTGSQDLPAQVASQGKL